MTARIRIAVAVAILFALATHPVVHPLVKECACLHNAATGIVERLDAVVLAVPVARATIVSSPFVDAVAACVLVPRAPPAH